MSASAGKLEKQLSGLVGDETRIETAAEAEQLAEAIGASVLDPSLDMGERELGTCVLYTRALANLLACTRLGNSDHLLEALGVRDTASLSLLRAKNPRAYAKSLLLLQVDSRLPIDLEAVFEAAPRVALLVYLSLLATKPVTTVAGQARRERLLELAPKLQAARFPRSYDHLVLVSRGFMLCSYAERRDKHEVKRTLNRVLRALMREDGMYDAALPAKRSRPERPTLLVAAEVMHSNHVQYRYFGQYLRQLATRFRLVLLTEEPQANPHARKLFEEVRLYERKGGMSALRDVVAWIKRLAPDLIFWPSVGMRGWGPALANLRLAPIQFTALGHSASTFCEQVDYYLTEEGYVGDEALFSERLVLLPDASLRFERSPHYRPVPPSVRQRAEPLRIVLPSNLLKLNPAFIAVLRRIQAEAGRALEFHVFPNVGGLEFAATRHVLGRELPGATVYPVMRYQAYVERLNDCDLNLSPFPFGGLHSVVDSLRQGIPVVAMEGLEPHARTDSMLLRRLGMPEWLISRDVESYVAAALRVIRDDALRVELSRQAIGLDIDRALYGDAGTPLGTEVVEAVWWMYEHHEAILASGRKAFRAAERANIPAIIR